MWLKLQNFKRNTLKQDVKAFKLTMYNIFTFLQIVICVCNLIFTRFWFSYYYLNYKNRVKKLNVNYNCLSKRHGTSKCCRKSEIKGLNRGLIIQDIDLEEKYRIINLYRIFNPPGGTSQEDPKRITWTINYCLSARQLVKLEIDVQSY